MAGKEHNYRARVWNHSGENDGDADSFGVGDLWVLRYYGGTEIDDGVTSVGGTPEQCKAHQDNFLTGENVENKDVVIWYAAHFTHIMFTKKWAILLSPP